MLQVIWAGNPSNNQPDSSIKGIIAIQIETLD